MFLISIHNEASLLPNFFLKHPLIPKALWKIALTPELLSPVYLGWFPKT